MSELHRFLFDGLPVRGALVRLGEGWAEVLRRRASNSDTGPYPVPVRDMLGEMLAAATLMQSNIKFDGALVLQIFGDGPVQVAVVEVQSDLAFRATATVVGALPPTLSLSQMINASQLGRCAITLDPKTKFPGQQPYQGVVSLQDEHGRSQEQLAAVLEHYRLQSQQLETTLVLAADASEAAGLLIQRLPVQGPNIVATGIAPVDAEDAYRRIALLAHSLQRDDLLRLDATTLLRRLFWEENLTRFAPAQGELAPRFSCGCSRDRVGRMIHGLGQAEVQAILAERDQIEVGCEFCGTQYRFDAIDAAQIFLSGVSTGGDGAAPH
ncbi:MAG: Hsp33 family molecular chaperone HslO [Rhodoferax sp.]